jgi:hypothetical protein
LLFIIVTDFAILSLTAATESDWSGDCVLNGFEEKLFSVCVWHRI